MSGRRSFLKGIFGVMTGFGCMVAPLPKRVAFPVPPDFAPDLSGFEMGWFQLEKTEWGYVVPKILATIPGEVLIITRSSHPGKLAVYSKAVWLQLVDRLRFSQTPTEVRSAIIRLIIAPAEEIDLRDHYLEIPKRLKAHAGLGNRSLLLAYDGEKGVLQAV